MARRYPPSRGCSKRFVRAAVDARRAYGVRSTAKFGWVCGTSCARRHDRRISADAGVAWIALHARTAQQHYAGEAHWDAIGELKTAVPEIPVLGNGDIWEAADAVRMMRHTGCDGVVIGRGCLGRPWLFGDLIDVFAGRPAPPPRMLGEVTAAMRRHAGLLVDHYLTSGTEVLEERRNRSGARYARRAAPLTPEACALATSASTPVYGRATRVAATPARAWRWCRRWPSSRDLIAALDPAFELVRGRADQARPHERPSQGDVPGLPRRSQRVRHTGDAT